MNGLTLEEIKQIEMMQQNQQYHQIPIQQQTFPNSIPVYNENNNNYNYNTYENSDYIEPINDNIADPTILGSSESTNKKKSNKKKEKEKHNKESILNFLLNEIKEPIIILILYLVLSQPFIFNLFSSQIKYLRPMNSGEMHLSGFIIYGSILSLLFYVTKKFI